ncbi:GNAT family N-acetyltransferase [Dankookia sp. GCM10030260]|uniref:GNAT family N-acetyltransferase n=1 Tax=Dankookia sp. GCM10030260 TaxID=3273390 RepID=UPI0036101D09
MTSRHGLEIRAAAAAEAPGLAVLLGAAGHVIDPRELATRLDAIRQGPGIALVALEWGPPSGLVVLHWYRRLEEARPVAQVTTLLVGTEERRRGIGRLLVKAAAQAARNAGCGMLELAAPESPELAAFCLATGFIPAGPRFLRPLRKAG